jgi:hypothetical protein
MVGSWLKPIPNEKRVFPKCFMQKENTRNYKQEMYRYGIQ